MFLREVKLAGGSGGAIDSDCLAVSPLSAVAVTVIVMGAPVVLGSTVSVTVASPLASVTSETALRVPLVVLKTIVTPSSG